MIHSNIENESDISNGGTLNSLLDIGLNIREAGAEAKENQQDQRATESRTLYDTKNRLIFLIDNGIKGANNERLKKMSNLHHRTKSSNEKHGFHNAGVKEYAMYFTNGFVDENNEDEKVLNPEIQQILDKPEKERYPLEKLKTVVTVISKTDIDEYDPVMESDLNQISLDFINPLYFNKIYKNSPTQATPLSRELWCQFSIDPTKCGTIIIIPVSGKRHIELMNSLLTKDVSENLLIFDSKTYNKLLIDDNIEITFECINFDIRIENGIQIDISPTNIPGLDTHILRAVPYDPLHFSKIDPNYKMSTDIYIFEKDKTIDDGSEEYKKSPYYLTIVKKEDNKYLKILENKGKPTSYQISKDNFDNEIRFYKKNIINITVKGAYSDNWQPFDLEVFRQIYGANSNFTNLTSLNGHYFERNNKISDKRDSPIKNQGDFELRTAYEKTRFISSYSSDMDKIAPPLIKKSEVKYENWPKEIRDTIEWVLKNFREKIKTILKDMNKKPIITKPVKRIIVDESDYEEKSESSESLVFSESEDNQESESSESLVSSESEDNGESDEDNTENIQVTVAEIPHEPIIPVTVPRKSNEAEYISKQGVFNSLDIWHLHQEKHNQLDEAIENLFRRYEIVDRFSFDECYKYFTIEQKISIIKNKIHHEKPIDTDTINGGIEFIRAYKLCFE
jgi:hypothetical protein